LNADLNAAPDPKTWQLPGWKVREPDRWRGQSSSSSCCRRSSWSSTVSRPHQTGPTSGPDCRSKCRSQSG
jgi:hypothetical protein